MEDKRNILKNNQPFSYKILKDHKAQIFYNNKRIKTISGKYFTKLQKIAQQNELFKLQLYLAKITGQFKHGNENHYVKK